MTDHDHTMRTQLIRACTMLHDEHLIAGSSGNVSMRDEHGKVLATPSGMSKAELGLAHLLWLTPDGRTLESTRLRPSSEIQVHLHIYQSTPDIRAVVHAHPITATALAERKNLDLCITAEGAASVGPVAQIPYIRPGTKALARLCAQATAEGATTLLLAQHGAVCIGRTLDEARFRMSSLEHVAKIWMCMHAAGTLHTLDADEVKTLRQQVNLNGSWPSHAQLFSLP